MKEKKEKKEIPKVPKPVVDFEHVEWREMEWWPDGGLAVSSVCYLDLCISGAICTVLLAFSDEESCASS